jgi:hypothetical protein
VLRSVEWKCVGLRHVRPDISCLCSGQTVEESDSVTAPEKRLRYVDLVVIIDVAVEVCCFDMRHDMIYIHCIHLLNSGLSAIPVKSLFDSVFTHYGSLN